MAVSYGASARPNIVFVFIDDLGYADFSCTGNRHVATENIDRMASEGVRFTQFYVASPICSPSRVAVTTGQYPARHLINSYLNSREKNAARGMRDYLDPAAPCVARAFRDAGYATAHFGKWHMGGGRDVDDAPLPNAYGFDESLVSFEGLGDRVLPPGGLSDRSARLGRGRVERVEKSEQTGIYVDRAIDFIRRSEGKPFYLHLWLNDVHDAHRPRADDLERFRRFAANPYVQRFYAVLNRMDNELGRLFDAIDALGLAEETVIALTGDNGPTAWPSYYRQGYDPPGDTGGFRGRKWSLYEGGVRMPLIVRWPGRAPAGLVDEQTLLGAVDLFPTFCGLADIPTPSVALDGMDMKSAFFGQPLDRVKPLFWEYGRDPSYLKPGFAGDRSPNLAMRSGRWKLLVNADGSGMELYDFSRSTSERANVADRYPDIARSLKDATLRWRAALPALPKQTTVP